MKNPKISSKEALAAIKTGAIAISWFYAGGVRIRMEGETLIHEEWQAPNLWKRVEKFPLKNRKWELQAQA